MVSVCSSQYVDRYIEENMNLYDSVELLYGNKVDLEGEVVLCSENQNNKIIK